jgi:hypothetical protein
LELPETALALPIPVDLSAVIGFSGGETSPKGDIRVPTCLSPKNSEKPPPVATF